MIEKYLNGLEIKKDELTAIERNKLLNEGKEVDRIMCCLDTGETLAPMIHTTLKEYYHSSEKMCELEEYIYETFHSDGAGVSCTLRGMAEAMGAAVKYYDYNIAQLDRPAISLDDAENARLVDIEKDGEKEAWRQGPCQCDGDRTVYHSSHDGGDGGAAHRYGEKTR